MKAVRVIYCLTCIVLLGASRSAWAQNHQARAQTNPASPSFVRTASYDSSRRAPASRPEISSPSFKVYGGGRGLWRGYVRGNGRIQLTLKILRGGMIESTRYIGSLVQSAWEKPTSFFFTASLPKGSDWSWLIVAEEI